MLDWEFWEYEGRRLWTNVATYELQALHDRDFKERPNQEMCKMKSLISQLFVAVTTVLTLLSCTSANAQTYYRIADLGTLGGPSNYSAANDINDGGEVVGQENINDTNAFFWDGANGNLSRLSRDCVCGQYGPIHMVIRIIRMPKKANSHDRQQKSYTGVNLRRSLIQFQFVSGDLVF